MKPVKVLPPSYIHYRDLKPPEYKKAHFLFFILALPLTWGVYTLLNRIADLLRPDYAYSPGLNPSFKPGIIAGLLLVAIVVIVAHELIHALLLWLFIRDRVEVSIHFPGIGIETPDWYIPRNKLLVVSLAPLIGLTLIGIAFLFIVPRSFIGTVVLAITINIVGAYLDVAVAAYTFLLPPSAYICPDHGYAAIFIREASQANASNWRTRLRVFLEREILPRLE
jgi:hypothetical protein